MANESEEIKWSPLVGIEMTNGPDDIICGCCCGSKPTENSSIYEYRNYIESCFCSSQDDVHDLLCKALGIDKSSLPDETQLIKDIAVRALKEDEVIEGHTNCSIAEWAVVLTEIGKTVYERYDAEIAGCLLIPHYARLFTRCTREHAIYDLRDLLK